MKKLYLVDVSSMFFRAFFAIPPLSNKDGLPTNALYGFLNMSVKLMKSEKPDYMVYCLDRKEPSFRKDLYEDYKANRSELPEDLVPQMPFIKKLTESLGIPMMDKEGYEADDIIGCLTKIGVESNLDVTIVSGDKDFAQLIGPQVSMLDTMKNVRYDEQGVIDKWGIRPDQMIDYLAIVGDSSDNIPGIKGVGPKGAQKLLGQYNDLDGIYEHVEEISGKSTKQKIIDGKDSAYLAKKLVTIVTDLDLGMKKEDMVLMPIDQGKVEPLFEELAFQGFLKKLTGNGPSHGSTKTVASKSKKSESSKTVVVKAEGSFVPLVEEKWSLTELAEKVEPYSEIWGTVHSRGLCLGIGKKAVTVDADRKDIGQVLGEKKLSWKGFDLKKTWRSLDLGSVETPDWDSMLAAYVIRAGNIEDFSKICQLYTGREFPELAGPGVLMAHQIHLEAVLKDKLAQVRGEKVYRELELPLVPVLFEMEQRGVLLDVAELGRQSKTLESDLKELEAIIHKEAGEPFNIASPKQLGQVLFEKLGLPPGKKTKTGFSTSSDVLAKLAGEYPICGHVQDYRELAKLKSTYVDSLPKLVDDKFLIHTELRQAVTTTGRLSSANPNLQNIPIRTDRGKMVRKAFVAQQDYQLLSVDYSQIELRVLAHITGDPGLTRAFEGDLDIHASTACEIFDVSMDELTSELRRKAKAVNFGIAYGQGAFGLSESLGIGRKEASDIIARYFLKFKKVKEFMHETVERAKSDGFVETSLGRRRYIDELSSSNGNMRKFGERAAINAPIQGTASDIMKKAMIDVASSVSSPVLLQVHDELLLECENEEVEEQAMEVKEVMENAASLNVPLRVNVAWGQNWEEAHA